MEKSPHKQLFSSQLDAALAVLQETREHLRIARAIAREFDLDMPEWAIALAPVVGIDSPDESKYRQDDKPAKGVPSFKDVVTDILSEHPGISTRELQAKYATRTGDKQSARIFRREMRNAEDQGWVFKVYGGSKKSNYWALKESDYTPPNKPDEKEVESMSGLPSMPIAVDGYFEIDEHTVAVEPSTVTKWIRKTYPNAEFRPHHPAQTMSRKARKGELYAKKYPGRHSAIYGPVQWANEGDDPERGFKPEHLPKELRQEINELPYPKSDFSPAVQRTIQHKLENGLGDEPMQLVDVAGRTGQRPDPYALAGIHRRTDTGLPPRESDGA